MAMLSGELLDDVATFAEMVEALDEEKPGTAREVLSLLADNLSIDASVKRPHPIMRRDMQMVFPDYRERAEYCGQALAGMGIVHAPEAKLRLMMYLLDSQALITLKAGRKKTTVAEDVYFDLIELADEYLEILDAQERVMQLRTDKGKRHIRQPNVSRSFQKLESLELLSKSGYCPETGKTIWRLETPHLSIHTEK